MIETTVPLDTTKASKYFLIDQLVKFFLPLGQSKKIFETFVALDRILSLSRPAYFFFFKYWKHFPDSTESSKEFKKNLKSNVINSELIFRCNKNSFQKKNSLCIWKWIQNWWHIIEFFWNSFYAIWVYNYFLTMLKYM